MRVSSLSMLRQHTTSSWVWWKIFILNFGSHSIEYRCEFSFWDLAVMMCVTMAIHTVDYSRTIPVTFGDSKASIFFAINLLLVTSYTATPLPLLLQSVSFFYYYFASLSLSHAYYAIENVTFFFGRLSCAHERADNAIGRNFKFFLVRLADIKEKGAVDAVDAVQGWSALSFFSSSSSSRCCSSESDVKEKNSFCLIPWGLSSFWLAVQYPHIDHTLEFRVCVVFDSLLNAVWLSNECMHQWNEIAGAHIFGRNISISAGNVQQISGREEGFLTLFIVVGRTQQLDRAQGSPVEAKLELTTDNFKLLIHFSFSLCWSSQKKVWALARRVNEMRRWHSLNNI